MPQSRVRRGRRSLLAEDNRENSGFGEVASGARREADRIDFLSRRKMGVFRRPIAPRDDDSVATLLLVPVMRSNAPFAPARPAVSPKPEFSLLSPANRERGPRRTWI